MAHEVRRIERELVLKTLIEKKEPISLYYQLEHFTGTLLSYNKESLTFQLINEKSLTHFKKGDRLSLFFRFHYVNLTCKVSYLNSENGILILSYPSDMYRDLTRDHERVENINEFSMSIITKDREMNIPFPASAGYYEPKLSERQPDLSTVSFSNVISSFRKRSKVFASKINVAMFKKWKPTNLMEHIIASSGKTLLLPFTNIERHEFRIDKVPLASKQDIEWICKEKNKELIDCYTELEKFQHSIEAENLFHALYSPILYYEYVVGYVCLMRNTRKTGFMQNHIEYVYKFTRLLARLMKANGYFNTLREEQLTDPTLIDISATGLLFNYPSDSPAIELIELYSNINLLLKTQETTLSLCGKVIRKFTRKEQTYMAVKFIDISYSDSKFLKRTLYGKDYEMKFDI